MSLTCLSQTVVVTDIPVYTTGDASAMLEIKSTTKGLLIPKVTLTSSLSSSSPVSAPVATGLLVYNEGANQPVGFYYWNGSAWTAVGGSVTADGSETKIISSSPIVTTGAGTTASHYNISFTTQSINKITRDGLVSPYPYAGQYIWCTDCGSGEFQYYNGVTWVNSSGGTRNLTIGESYQGGKVAYIFQSGDPSYVAGEVHGIIAAPSDICNAVAWGCTSDLNGAAGTALGTGTQNTNDIVTYCGTSGTPARLCFEWTLTENGVTYKDWFLPSLDELNKLYQNTAAIGGFYTSTGYYYWTSSEISAANAYTIHFLNGTATGSAKTSSTSKYRARAIRYF
jgi:hypothetical protein